MITGVGFLGAGVILHPRAGAAGAAAAPAAPAAADPARAPALRPRDRDVRGLTTAATVWVAAVLGLASGFGRWSLALIATGLTLGVLALGGSVEDAVRRRFVRRARARRRR